MSAYLSVLTEEEKEFIYELPARAAILVGGADDDFDVIERKVATELTHLKAFTSNEYLQEYFAEVSTRFVADVDRLMAAYPNTAKERNPQIREELNKASEVLLKIDGHFTDGFDDAIIEIARYVAEASGGVLGFLAISKVEERALCNLTRILKEQAY